MEKVSKEEIVAELFTLVQELDTTKYDPMIYALCDIVNGLNGVPFISKSEKLKSYLSDAERIFDTVLESCVKRRMKDRGVAILSDWLPISKIEDDFIFFENKEGRTKESLLKSIKYSFWNEFECYNLDTEAGNGKD